MAFKIAAPVIVRSIRKYLDVRGIDAAGRLTPVETEDSVNQNVQGWFDICGENVFGFFPHKESVLTYFNGSIYPPAFVSVDLGSPGGLVKIGDNSSDIYLAPLDLWNDPVIAGDTTAFAESEDDNIFVLFQNIISDPNRLAVLTGSD